MRAAELKRDQALYEQSGLQGHLEGTFPGKAGDVFHFSCQAYFLMFFRMAQKPDKETKTEGKKVVSCHIKNFFFWQV